MKKLFVFLLTVAMSLFFAACNGGNDISSNTGNDTTPPVTNNQQGNTSITNSGENSISQDETSPQIEMLEVGETIFTENFEFTLTKVVFGTNLNDKNNSKDYLIIDGDYPTTYRIVQTGEIIPKHYVADEGRAYVVIEYALKYNGKTNNRWEQKISVDYNDGYIFSNYPKTPGLAYSDFLYRESKHRDSEDEYWMGARFLDFEPLAPEQEIRSVFDVPAEVKNSTDAPLKIRVSLDGTDYIYFIR